MKNICIIETESHHEVVRNLVLSIINNAKFTIISNTNCLENLTVLQHKNVKLLNYEDLSIEISKLISKQKFDYKLTITPPSLHFFRNHTDWFINSNLIIHNMNYWLAPHSNIYFLKHPNIRSFLKFLKYWPEIKIKRKLFNNFFLNLIAPSIELYINYSRFSKLTDYVRLDWYENTGNLQKEDLIKIVIPGTVNSSRNYGAVLSILDEISKELEIKIEVTLLGKNTTLKTFNQSKNYNLEIITYEKMVPENQYINVLRTSTFAVLPLIKEVEKKGILELKGVSNISGGINDLYYVGLRGIIPDFYKLQNNNLFETYSNKEELKSLLIKFITMLSNSSQTNHFINNNMISQHNLKVIGFGN